MHNIGTLGRILHTKSRIPAKYAYDLHGRERLPTVYMGGWRGTPLGA
jgi:hypothetical protein